MEKNNCAGCPMNQTWAIIILIIGVLYLLQDLGVAAVSFWTFKWYTIMFLIIGLMAILKK